MNIYRQGDILLKECTLPKNIEKVNCEDKIILAEGEATGHFHAINDTKNAAMFFDKNNNKIYLMITQPVELVHEEHAVIKLPISNYEVIRQREYHPEAIRTVKD
jgi:hypothetical protein